MPDILQEKFHSGNLEGVKIANVFHLSDKVNLTGDTVIIARKVVFEGKTVTIKGPHGIHIFAIDSIGSNGATVTIDTSGPGRTEWLQKKASGQVALGKKSNRLRTSGVKFVNANFSSNSQPLAVLQNADGHPSVDGQPGNPGYSGSDGNTGYTGMDGNCREIQESPAAGNGNPGGDGTNGDEGAAGGRGSSGTSGTSGGPVTINITTPSDTTQYYASSKGGNGGNGGPGGAGGRGGNAGAGGRGGNGANCGCFSGGNGGNGGIGGGGGTGGDGGDGGSGGNGGTITINYPAGYNTTGYVHTDVSAGAAGAGGSGGTGGYGGSGARGGDAGSNTFACNAPSGHAGVHGNDGAGGGNGNPGNPGSAGQPGSVNYNQTGGDGGGDLEPGNSDGYCTEWWWVWYEWSCEFGMNATPKSIMQTVSYTKNSPLRKTLFLNPIESCGWRETHREYAGRW